MIWLADSPAERSLLRKWVAYYGLESGFKREGEVYSWETPTKGAMLELNMDDALSLGRDFQYECPEGRPQLFKSYAETLH